MTDSSLPYSVFRKPATLSHSRGSPTRRTKEDGRETGNGQQKTAIMEVNYKGVIAEGKIRKSKESIGDFASLSLSLVFLPLLQPCTPSFFILSSSSLVAKLPSHPEGSKLPPIIRTRSTSCPLIPLLLPSPASSSTPSYTFFTDQRDQ